MGKKLRFRADAFSLVAILAVAFLLRVYNLGHLGLIYVRGIIHLAMSALSAFLFDLSEFSLRLPSVLVSLADYFRR